MYEVSKLGDGMIVIDMKTARERKTKDDNAEENS